MKGDRTRRWFAWDNINNTYSAHCIPTALDVEVIMNETYVQGPKETLCDAWNEQSILGLGLPYFLVKLCCVTCRLVESEMVEESTLRPISAFTFIKVLLSFPLTGTSSSKYSGRVCFFIFRIAQGRLLITHLLERDDRYLL